MAEFRKETDSFGEVEVPADKLWGAQTQRSLEHFSIGKDLIPREMITAYAILKKAAANANHAGRRLDDKAHKLIVQVCRRNPDRATPRHVSAACLDDRQRHAVQHERQRGDLEPLLPACRHAARQQDAGASERSRQHVAIVQRLVSLGDVHRGGARGDAAPCPGVRALRDAIAAKAENGRTSSRSAAPTCRMRRRSRSARNGRAMRAC